MLDVSEEDVLKRAEHRKDLREQEILKANGELPTPVEPLDLLVPRYLFKRALSVGWLEVFRHVDRATLSGEDPQKALVSLLTKALRERGIPIMRSPD